MVEPVKEIKDREKKMKNKIRMEEQRIKDLRTKLVSSLKTSVRLRQFNNSLVGNNSNST